MRSSIRAIGCVVLMWALPGGCNIVGPAYVLLHGPPSIPPEFTLDKERTTALLIDDRRGVLPRPILGQRIAEVTEATLLDRRLIDDLVSGKSTRLVTKQESNDKPLSLSEIGEAVDADVLISVTIDTFTLSPDGQTFSPMSVARVKVFDVASGESLWPDEPEGFTRTVRMPIQQGGAPTTRADLAKAQEDLASWTGVGIAQLFFKREVTEDRGRG